MKKVYGLLVCTLVLSLSVDAFAAGRTIKSQASKVELTGSGTPSHSPRVSTGGDQVYLNDVDSGYFLRTGDGVWDDATLAGVARELVSYTQELHRRSSEPPNFTSETSLSTNDDSGSFPVPGDEIAGTACEQTDVGVFDTRECKVGFDSGIILPDTVWAKATADGPQGGWLLGGAASVGSSEDLLADADGPFNLGGCPPAGAVCGSFKWSLNASVPPPVPTVSEWGLIVIMLLVLTGGTIVLRKARPTTAHA